MGCLIRKNEERKKTAKARSKRGSGLRECPSGSLSFSPRFFFLSLSLGKRLVALNQFYWAVSAGYALSTGPLKLRASNLLGDTTEAIIFRAASQSPTSLLLFPSFTIPIPPSLTDSYTAPAPPPPTHTHKTKKTRKKMSGRCREDVWRQRPKLSPNSFSGFAPSSTWKYHEE